MTTYFFFLRITIIVLTLIPGISFSAESFYDGKTINVIVGNAPGGGFDTSARIVARHMGRYIPGNPTVIVQNMPGAGGLIAANTLYKVTKPDGLTFGHFNGGLYLNQLLKEPGIEFDAKKFEYIGTLLKNWNVFLFGKASGITSVEKWVASKTSLKIGGTAPGAMTDNVIRITKAALGLPIQIISGYVGGLGERILAVSSGELAGVAAEWDTIKIAHRKALETGDLVPVLQTVPKALPDLPNVPLAINLAKTAEARQLIEVGIHSPSVFIRPFALPPGTPKERVQILRKAFQDTLKDKQFLAEVEKSKMDINLVTGEDLEKAVSEFFKLDPVMVAKLKKILFD